MSSGRVTLSFIQGENNPSDGLTKSPESSLFDHLVETCGLERMCEEDVQSLMVPENLKGAVEELDEVQEWPKSCGLWKEETYQKEKKRLGLNFGRVVDRCAFDRVFKRWYFATNRAEWCEIFSGKPCDKNHVHVSPESLEATGFYPSRLGRALLRAARVVLGVPAVGVSAVRTFAEDETLSTEEQ